MTVRHQVGARKLIPGPRLVTTDLFLMGTGHWRNAGASRCEAPQADAGS